LPFAGETPAAIGLFHSLWWQVPRRQILSCCGWHGRLYRERSRRRCPSTFLVAPRNWNHSV